MSLNVKHKISNRTSSMVYNHWIHEIVNKGEAKDYIILEYPDLVQLLIIHPDGKTEKDKILERDKAKEKIKKFPNAYDFEEINVKELIANDIKRSNKNKNQSSKSLKTKYRIKIKPMINAIKTLNPVWKFIISIIAMIVGGFLTYLIIEWYKTLSYV